MGPKRGRLFVDITGNSDDGDSDVEEFDCTIVNQNLNNCDSESLESNPNSSTNDEMDEVVYQDLVNKHAKLKKLKLDIAKSLRADRKLEKYGKFSKDAFTRFSVRIFSSVVDALDEMQSSVVSKYGFGPLLLFQKCVVPNKFAKWLIRHIDCDARDIIINGKVIPLTPESVHHILGLPIGGTPFPSDSAAGKSKILSMFGKLSMPQVTFYANKLINKEVMSDEETFVCFMLVALNSFLCPNSSLTPSSTYLGVFENVDEAKDFDWSSYVLNWLLQKAKEFTRGKSNGIKGLQSKTLGGCLYYLAVRYLDCVDFGDHQAPAGMPRISVWKGDMIKTYSELDSFGPRQYGQMPILDASLTRFAKQVPEIRNPIAPMMSPSDFKSMLAEYSGNKLSEVSKDEICSLMEQFTASAKFNVNLDATSIGSISDDLKCAVANMVTHIRNVDHGAHQLVLSVVKIVYEARIFHGNSNVREKGTAKSMAHDTPSCSKALTGSTHVTPKYSNSSSPDPLHHGVLPESAVARARARARATSCQNYDTCTEIACLRDPLQVISDDEISISAKKVMGSASNPVGKASSDFIHLDSENIYDDSESTYSQYTMPRYCSQKFDGHSEQPSIRNPLTHIDPNNVRLSNEITQSIIPKFSKKDDSLFRNKAGGYVCNAPRREQPSLVQVIPANTTGAKFKEMTKDAERLFDPHFSPDSSMDHEVGILANEHLQTSEMFIQPGKCVGGGADHLQNNLSSGGKPGHYGPRRMVMPTKLAISCYETSKRLWQVTSNEYDNYKAICELASSEYSNENAVDLGGVRCTFWSLGSSLMPKGAVNNFVIAAFCRYLLLQPGGHPYRSRKHYFFPSISDNLLKPVGEADQDVLSKAFTKSTKARPLANSNLLFFPTCYQDHWFVFIVDIKDRRFVFLDSFYNSKDKFQEHVREMLINSFAVHWKKYIKIDMPFDRYEILYPDIPKQSKEKMYDSGVYAMMSLEHWSSPRTILSSIFQLQDIPRIRAKVANNLVFMSRNTGRKDLVTSFDAQA